MFIVWLDSIRTASRSAVLDDDVLLVLVLVALDQVGALDQPELGVDRLHVDAVVGVLVQLVEARCARCALVAG